MTLQYPLIRPEALTYILCPMVSKTSRRRRAALTVRIQSRRDSTTGGSSSPSSPCFASWRRTWAHMSSARPSGNTRLDPKPHLSLMLKPSILDRDPKPYTLYPIPIPYTLSPIP